MGHVRWGLDRIETLLEGLGRPDRSFRALHFGGTNGKGSAAATAFAVLRESGARTGLYTSPHLIHPRERIRLGPLRETDDLLDRAADRVRPLADRSGATYFEALTAVACLVFAEAEVEWAVVETGLGGRLDATNALRPVACGILSVSLDHTEYLGTSLEEVAGEKAGIIKPGVPLAIGPMPSPAVRRVLEMRARRVGAPFRALGEDARVERVRVGLSGTSFVYRSSRWPRGLSLHTRLVGRHQAANAAVALMTLEDAAPTLDEELLVRAMGRITLPGRFQVLGTSRGPWVLDIAHNRAAVEALRRTLDSVSLPGPFVFLVAILRDKPWREMLEVLTRPGDRLLLTEAPSAPPERRWDPREAAAALGTAAEVVVPLPRALERAVELARPGTVVVTGSVHTVGDVLQWLDGETGPRKGAAGRASAEPDAWDVDGVRLQ